MYVYNLEDSLSEAVTAKRAVEELLKQARAELETRDRLLKSVTAQLNQQTAQLKVILDNTLVGIVHFDEDFYVVRANQFAEHIFGYDAGGLFGSAATDLVVASVEDVLDKAVVDNVRNINSRPMEYKGKRRNGSLFPAEILISKISVKGRKHTVWFIRDITERMLRESERKRLELELQQAQRLESLGTLASGIAHEINTPIQFIGDNLQFLQQAFGDLVSFLDVDTEAGPDDELIMLEECGSAEEVEFLKVEIPNAITESLEGIERVSEIVRSVRDFSHPGLKERSLVDINQAIRTTVTISRNHWKYVALLETHLAPDLPKIKCVAGQINQVLLNLIVNAAQAIEEKGASGPGMIKITTGISGPYVEICVSDTGCGIAKEIEDKIFDPFFTTKDVGKGTGQGLSLAHSVVVKRHQGKLTFRNGPSGGTEFVVQLPIGNAEMETVVEE